MAGPPPCCAPGCLPPRRSLGWGTVQCNSTPRAGRPAGPGRGPPVSSPTMGAPQWPRPAAPPRRARRQRHKNVTRLPQPGQSRAACGAARHGGIIPVSVRFGLGEAKPGRSQGKSALLYAVGVGPNCRWRGLLGPVGSIPTTSPSPHGSLPREVCMLQGQMHSFGRRRKRICYVTR